VQSIRLKFFFKSPQARRLACGWNHSAALSDTGQLFTWGKFDSGALGLGETVSVDDDQQDATIELHPFVRLGQILGGGNDSEWVQESEMELHARLEHALASYNENRFISEEKALVVLKM